MTNNWKKVKIKDLLNYERPDKYIVENDRYTDNGIAVLTANKSFILGYTNETTGIYKNIPVIIFDDFTTDIKYVDFPFKVKSSAIKILKEKNSHVDLLFVYELMSSRTFPTGAHKRYYISQYQNMEVLVPPVEMQHKIASILFSVTEAIRKTDEIIQKTGTLKQELMKTLLTKGIGHKEFKKTKIGVMPENWAVVALKDVVKITSGQVDPKNEPYASMILLAPNHIESGSGRILERERAKDQQAISGKYLVEKGDVIYSKIRPYLKKVTIADSACLCSADMYPLKGLNNLNNNFLFHILLSEHFTNYANSNSGRTGIPKLNREELGNYTFALPPIKEQIEISSILSSMDEKILTNQEIKKKYVLIKNGLMNDIFNQKVQIN